MAFYQKRPYTIEAKVYDGSNWSEITSWVMGELQAEYPNIQGKVTHSVEDNCLSFQFHKQGIDVHLYPGEYVWVDLEGLRKMDKTNFWGSYFEVED